MGNRCDIYITLDGEEVDEVLEAQDTGELLDKIEIEDAVSWYGVDEVLGHLDYDSILDFVFGDSDITVEELENRLKALKEAVK